MVTGARAVSVCQVDKTLNKPLQLTRDAASLTSNRRIASARGPGACVQHAGPRRSGFAPRSRTAVMASELNGSRPS